MLSKRLTLLPLVPLGLLLASCGDDDINSSDPNGTVGFVEPTGTTPPTGTPAPLMQSFSLTLTGPNGAGIEGATIIVQLDGDTITAKSDSKGFAKVEILARLEVLGVHIFHPDYAYTSVYGLPSDELSISLRPLSNAPAETQLATVAGEIRGWDMLPQISDGVARVATVVAAGRSIVEPAQSPRPGTVTPDNPEGTDFNWAVVGNDPFPSWHDYQLTVDRRATALVALAGTFTLADQPILELTHIGIVPSMSFPSNDELVVQDVQLTHPLDHKLEIVRLGSTLEESTGYLGLELEDGAIVTLGASRLGDGGMATGAPGLYDALAGAKYWSAVDLRSKDTVAGAPRAEVFSEQSSLSSSFTFDGLLDPPGRPSAAGRTLAASLVDGAEMHRFSLIDAAGVVIWSAYVQGTVSRSIELPELPQEIEDRVHRAKVLEVTAFDLDPADTSLDGLESRAKSWSSSRDLVDL